MNRLHAFLYRVFYGDAYHLSLKYFSVAISVLASPIYCWTFWRLGLPNWAVVVLGVVLTAVTFVILVIFGDWMLSAAVRNRRPETGPLIQGQHS